MLRLILFIGLIAIAFWIRHWWRTTLPEQRRIIFIKSVLFGGIALLLLAIMSGHLNPLFAALATLGLAFTRIERVLKWIPELRQLFQSFNQQQSPKSPPQNGHLSDAEARAILGVAANADAETIRAAHRRLMQRLHPDRGGSDCLAAQINAAKQRLIGD
ncbi:hypothetical protein CKO09_06985 [Chromatium weissei]|nr:hypothetical protein [Chromatium weissei]